MHCNGTPDGYRPRVVQSKPTVQTDFQFEADNGFSLKVLIGGASDYGFHQIQSCDFVLLSANLLVFQAPSDDESPIWKSQSLTLRFFPFANNNSILYFQ